MWTMGYGSNLAFHYEALPTPRCVLGWVVVSAFTSAIGQLVLTGSCLMGSWLQLGLEVSSGVFGREPNVLPFSLLSVAACCTCLVSLRAVLVEFQF